MSNYIDSDRIDLKNYLMHKNGKILYSDDFFAGIKWVIDRIDEMPSIDIVRCKECKKAHLTYDGDCKYCEEWKDEDGFLIEVYHDKNFFCGYGERNCSEKPNNSTISKMEQVDKDINVRSKESE